MHSVLLLGFAKKKNIARTWESFNLMDQWCIALNSIVGIRMFNKLIAIAWWPIARKGVHDAACRLISDSESVLATAQRTNGSLIRSIKMGRFHLTD